eukprot:5761995-Pleurochrysis_carterae.AAC.1
MFTHVILRTPSFGVYYVIGYYSGSTWSDHPGQAGKWLFVQIPMVNGRGAGAGAGAERTYGTA